MVQRNLDAVAGRQFDLAVIGGGIVGAFCACDASRRGLRVLLVEAHDFGAAASEAMSHLVHGGLRYLAQGRLNLVREGLVERNRWRRFAPHRVAAQTFLVPVRKDSPLTEFTRRIGVGVYDLMGRGLDGAAPARWLNAEAAIDMEPALAAAPLAGACAYEDCRVDEPERAVLALIADAGLHGALALNHAACAGLEIKDGRVEALLIEDQLTGETFPASARAILNAAGAAADSVASMLLPGQKSVRITRSKGVHFVTLPIVRRAALALGDAKRHAFVIPWKGFTLIGTSDVQIAESTASAGPSDLAELESRVRDLMPGLGALDVLDGYAGVRSLPGQAGSTYKAARDIAFADHADEGAAGLFAIFGGKWTTARLMAERAVDAIVRQLGRSAAPCDTTRRPLACTPDSPADFVRSWRARLPSWPEGEIAVWAGAYGRDFGRVLSPIADADGLDADAREAARFAYAVESEMAVTAEDVSRRLARWSSIARPGLEERAAAFLARPKVSGG
jgi:glycerol-3-phosphate dehydrogenase